MLIQGVLPGTVPESAESTQISYAGKHGPRSLERTPRIGVAKDALSGFLRLRSGHGFRRAFTRFAPLGLSYLYVVALMADSEEVDPLGG